MSTNECSQLMKKGACFICKKIGHLSKDCPNKKIGNFSQQKKTGKDTYAQIWAMIAQLPKEEKKNMMDEMEKRSIGDGFLKRRTVLVLVSPSLDIYSVDSLQDKNSLNITICVQNNQKKETAETPAHLDSGAGGIFIDQNHA